MPLPLVATLTFHLFTSKSNQFVFVPKCTKTVNLGKLPPKWFTKYLVQKLMRCRHRQPENVTASAAFSRRQMHKNIIEAKYYST